MNPIRLSDVAARYHEVDRKWVIQKADWPVVCYARNIAVIRGELSHASGLLLAREFNRGLIDAHHLPYFPNAEVLVHTEGPEIWVNAT